MTTKQIETMRKLLFRTVSPCLLVTLSFSVGCQRGLPPQQPAADQGMPLAYTSNLITDPALRSIAEDIQSLAEKQAAGGRSLFSRAEVLVPAKTVQPYGVGAFQQELRLPVILTTGPGWAGLEQKDKEAKVAELFGVISTKLETLKRKPPLRPTLTVQTPQGMELAWINHLDASGKNLHGDD